MTANNSAPARESSPKPAAQAGTIAIGGDLRVNRMGYGSMRITGPGIWGPPADRAEAIRVLRRAVELGVDFIDTADSYGPHVSEEIIAEALHPYPSGLVIATKGGLERPGPDKWTPNGRPEYLRKALDGSLKRLKLERIDLWQLHRIDDKVPQGEQFGVLADFIREGKVRNVGLSEADTEQINAARKVVPIVSVQNRYNIVDREWDAEVDYCAAEGLAFIPWFPLVAGKLEDADQAAITARRIEAIAKRHGANPMQVALAWLLARSPAMLVIPGTSKVAHLEENVRAAELELSDEEIESLTGIVPQS
ncbi:MAG: NADP-dependent oxidoreductase domain protein [Gemmatimonadetes bacterium]|nr:NADP-dependent oxidoreductase domain protein [Gemmatimonadota bacterium]